MTITKTIIDSGDAVRIGQAAVEFALSGGFDVTIAIVDDGGHLLWLRRLTGASASTAPIAEGKARSAAVTRRSTKFYEDMLAHRPAFLNAPGLDCLLEGGLPILHGDQCLGGIGVSGVKSEDDVAIAQAGLSALSVGSVAKA